MSNLNKVWVKDTRDPDGQPFLHAEHLLKYSQHLERAERPKSMQRTVSEPAQTPNTQQANAEQADANKAQRATTRKSTTRKKN